VKPLLPALVLSLAGTAACGASIQAVYEGDVRFEHCMALDSRPDVKPTIRRACWEEWQKFYTFGQTRDRVEFARMREKQLSSASDFDEGDWAMSARNSKAVPEPTSALAPPPMMLSTPTDGGAPSSSGSDGGTATDAGTVMPGASEPPSSDCSEDCQDTWTSCREKCKTPACEKGCAGAYKRCMRKCF